MQTGVPGDVVIIIDLYLRAVYLFLTALAIIRISTDKWWKRAEA